jgi:hypothetical protein
MPSGGSISRFLSLLFVSIAEYVPKAAKIKKILLDQTDLEEAQQS